MSENKCKICSLEGDLVSKCKCKKNVHYTCLVKDRARRHGYRYYYCNECHGKYSDKELRPLTDEELAEVTRTERQTFLMLFGAYIGSVVVTLLLSVAAGLSAHLIEKGDQEAFASIMQMSFKELRHTVIFDGFKMVIGSYLIMYDFFDNAYIASFALFMAWTIPWFGYITFDWCMTVNFVRILFTFLVKANRFLMKIRLASYCLVSQQKERTLAKQSLE